ncbi:MAG: 16S rRNA processing protein RimM [Campylobacterales bacterium]|nr:16S rRNA processing protein RimM [Campylobacterales bacterium]
MKKNQFLIAQIGRTVGLYGDLKLHLFTDFPEQFQKGMTFQSSRGDLTIASVDHKRGIVHFVGYEDMDHAKKLTNVKIYTSEEATKENCHLEEGEHFWFDIIGCSIQENDTILGVVSEIQRMADVDYLAIDTDEVFVKRGLPKHFLLPYIPRYIIKADTGAKTIYVQDAKDILEAS